MEPIVEVRRRGPDGPEVVARVVPQIGGAALEVLPGWDTLVAGVVRDPDELLARPGPIGRGLLAEAGPVPFDGPGRRALLQVRERAAQARRDANRAGDRAAAVDAEEVLARTAREYIARLPRPSISRCPWTGDVVSHSIDQFGLDGPWWDAETPLRPFEDLPPTWFAFSGAMAIASPVEPTPFLVKPGPGAPFVVPRLLERDEVLAVVTSVPVGRHQGWAIVYFASGPVPGPRIDDWSAATYPVRRDDGTWGWSHADEWPSEWDFDLVPWLEQEKLAWVFPGDGTFTLRAGAEGCPYVGLPGPRTSARVYAGQVQYPKPMDPRLPKRPPGT